MRNGHGTHNDNIQCLLLDNESDHTNAKIRKSDTVLYLSILPILCFWFPLTVDFRSCGPVHPHFVGSLDVRRGLGDRAVDFVIVQFFQIGRVVPGVLESQHSFVVAPHPMVDVSAMLAEWI